MAEIYEMKNYRRRKDNSLELIAQNPCILNVEYIEKSIKYLTQKELIRLEIEENKISMDYNIPLKHCINPTRHIEKVVPRESIIGVYLKRKYFVKSFSILIE